MNFKTTIVLLIVLAGIGAYLFVTRPKSETTTPEKSLADAKKLIDVKPEDVQRLSIVPASGKPVTFERSGADWKMVEPFQSMAENYQVDDLVRDVVAIQTRGELDADKKASLGLDHPSYTIQITTKDGKTTKVMAGDKPQIGDSLAVMLEGRDKPQIVNSSIYAKLEKKPDSYRRTRLVTLSTDQVRQLSLTHKDQTLRLIKPAADWEVVEPRKMPADSAAVSDVLFGLSGLTAHKFPEGYTAQDTGLVKPKAVVEFSTEAPATQPTTASTSPTTRPAGTRLKLGDYADVPRTEIFAQVDDGPIATVPASTLDTFNKTALDLRDKKVMDVDSDRVESISVHIDRPSTTQPTTKPAEQRTFTIARRKESRILGPVLPAPPVSPTTAPASAPTTAPTTQPTPSHPTPSAAGPSTEPAASPAAAPTTVPTTRPTTEPATQPLTASTPATRPLSLPEVPPFPAQPASKWVFRSGGEGDAEEGQVKTLLDAFHPLKAEKYLEKLATTQPAGTFTLTITAGPGPNSGPAEYSIRFVDPGGDAKLIAIYNDLVFEVDRAILKDLEGDFKTKKIEPPSPPSFPGGGGPGSFLPPGHP